jgi:2-polyprenyl-3-methyl-5-hydroxy-6-metoxy-1,4-benzoquinol methylase
MDSAIFQPNVRFRVLVAVASYGTSNDRHLFRLVEEYRAMSFDVDIVILSNLKKQIAPDIEVVVGLPNNNPWSLPFAHKKLFADRLERYDLFVYSEDDILITEKNLRAFLDASAALQEDELAGFLRIEQAYNDVVNYPDVHGNFHWDSRSIRSRGRYILAKFTNEHAACYVLTRGQLRKAIASGGFLVEPHQEKYDLACSAATDPYTQCGFTKLIAISHLNDFTVHHLSNKYIGKVGVEEAELRTQVKTMLRLAEKQCAPIPLLNTETRIWAGIYSKDYHEPLSKEVLSMIPREARSVLSIGCGSGATECWLAEKGLRVVAVPLDPIICSTSASRGVQMVLGDLRTAKQKLQNDRFDCLLYLNVLHLARDPIELLSAFKEILSVQSTVIIQTPNMLCGPTIWKFRKVFRLRDLRNYDLTGVNFTSPATVRRWCRCAGIKTERTIGILDRRAENVRNLVPAFVNLFMAPTIVISAKKEAR